MTKTVPPYRFAIAAMLTLTLARPGLAQDIPPGTDACAQGLTETAPSTEFELLEDGDVVRHTRTALEWKRCAEGQRWDRESSTCRGHPAAVSWEKARERAARAGGDWRLPEGEELLTIVERCHNAPAINPQVFPNTPASLFWTASTDTGGLGRAWSVSFFGGQYYRTGKTQTGRLRLVRGTMKRNPAP